MTDAQAISRNRSDVQDAIVVWNALTVKDRAAWISTFADLFKQVMLRESSATPSGDPEDAQVPDCPPS